MTAQVIQFRKYKTVTGWSLNQIRDYMKQHHWHGFRLHWRDGDDVIIERTTR